MNRREALQTIAGGAALLAVPQAARGNPLEFELLRAGVDSKGDYFSVDDCRHAVLIAKLPLPIYENFDHLRPMTGQITVLRMDGDRIMATVDSVPMPGMELAMEAYCYAKPRGPKEGPRSMGAFSIIGASFTRDKIK